MTQENKLYLLLRLVEEIVYQVIGLDIVLFVCFLIGLLRVIQRLSFMEFGCFLVLNPLTKGRETALK